VDDMTQTVNKAATTESIPAEKKRITLGRVLSWTMLVLVIFITLFPFYWMLRTALSNGKALSANSSNLLPAEFTWGAFKRVLGLSTIEEAQAEGGSGATINFWLYLMNSVVVSTIVTIGQVFFSAMAAYAFSRMRWPGRDLVFGLFLAALMVPPIFTMLPNFVLMKQLDLLNTYAGIILPFFFMTPFAIFFLRQFFLGISPEIEEAARLDGAGHFRIFLRVVLPMSTAPIATLSILTYVAMWNEYLWPLLVATEENRRVLTVALGIFRSSTPQGLIDWPGLMAATLLGALPIIALFCIFGRKIVNNIQFSGIK
jgi:multiple sugar transport system permease protein